LLKSRRSDKNKQASRTVPARRFSEDHWKFVEFFLGRLYSVLKPPIQI
jgi:hypothetical protein